MKLKLRDLKDARRDTFEELKKLKQLKPVRKTTINQYWQAKVPGLEKRDKATIKEISLLGKMLSKGKLWISDFTASAQWANEIRIEFDGTVSRSNQFTDVFKKAVRWTEKKLLEDGIVYLDEFKEKYTAFNGGEPSKSGPMSTHEFEDG